MAQNIIRAYLKQVIGLGDNAEGTIKANAFIGQGMDDITEIHEFSGSDDIKNLCAAVRKPGGQVENPDSVAAHNAAVTANAAAAQNAQVPVPPITMMTDPGHNVPTVCELRLTLAAQGGKMYTSIGRDVNATTLSRTRLREFRKHLTMVARHTNPDPLPEISRAYGIMKFLDQFPSLLRETLGGSQVALSYVLRDEAVPNTLPALLANKIWSDGKTSFMDELIAYMPHSGQEYDEDNAMVFTLLMHSLSGSQHMASITQYQSKRDGRKAFKSLFMHNMGSSKWEKMVESAEMCLNQRVYNGKNPRYPLRDHIARNREAFNDMVRAKGNISYEPPNETTRVRLLLNSIIAPELVSAKNVIMADPAKKDDFEQAADYLLLVAPVKKPGPSYHRISMVNHQTGKRKRVVGVEDRYYKLHEWKALTQDQRDEVNRLRDARKAKKRGNGGDTTKIAALQAENEQKDQVIAALQAAIAKDPPTGGKVPALVPPPGYKGGKKKAGD